MTIKWGAEIEVGGVRPDWLKQDVRYTCRYVEGDWGDYGQTTSSRSWNKITSIRLPADHFAYVAIAKGYKPWGGGSEAPKDWDGGRILYRDGENGPPIISWWTHDGGDAGGKPNDSDIIGYHPKPIAQPSPADTVTVPVMSEDEAYVLAVKHGSFAHYARSIGIIVPNTPTRAERIATTTGIALPDVEAVLNAIEEIE